MGTTMSEDILDHIPAVVFRLSHKDDNWRTIYVNDNVDEYGYTRDDFMSGKITWLDLVHPDDKVSVLKTIKDYETHHINEFRMHYRLVEKDGDSIPVTDFNTINRDAEGNIVSYDSTIVGSALESSRGSRELIDNHYRQQIVLNDILLSLQDADLDHALQIILDRTGEYLDTSRALFFKDSPDHVTCKVIYEWDNRDITSVKDLDYSITYETEMPEIYVALQTTGSLIVDFGNIPENCKEEFEAEGLIASAIFAIYLNGEHYGFVCFDDCVIERVWDDDTVRFLKNISNLVSNVVARQHAAELLKKSQQAVEDMAYTDYLTGLGNRFSSDRDLKEAIADAAQAGKSSHVLFLDLDDFKVVNDCYGHDYGDAILVTVARWLEDQFSHPHKVYRFGGDEFVVLLDYHNAVNIDDILQQLQLRGTKPWKALDREFYCTFSVGVVDCPAAEKDSLTIIKHADIAMYEAKRLGKNRHSFYESGLDVTSQERSNTEALLRDAMKNDFTGFEVYYQPIVRNKAASIEGAEALLRIHDGDRVVLPDEFLVLAEYLGFTVDIGEYVFRTAMQECKRINEEGYPDFKMCVNMTAKQIQQQDVLKVYEGIIDETGVNPENIVISVSEQVAFDSIERTCLVCTQLRKKGVSISLDDFGGGSASFMQLRNLPVDVVTTSISLLDDIDNPFSRTFIELLIELAHSIDKTICINGIETEAQYEFSKASAADKLQGFYLYKVTEIGGLKEALRG